MAIYPVIVNPVPDVIFSPAPQNICSGQTSQLVTLSSSTPNVTIQWTAIIPNSISNDSTGTVTIAPQTLVNTTNQPLTITYSAQATTSGATLCPGIPVDYSISVIPIPEIDFNLSINNGCTPLIVTFEPVIQKMGVPDSITFSWDDGSASTVIYQTKRPRYGIQRAILSITTVISPIPFSWLW
ncbi:MAG: hypothetical protein IPP77_03450 [Bacteroidetes bacterium]|nr:hypothetical protein [Bacteroidota bacterium]